MVEDRALWEASHMQETAFQRFIRLAIDSAPRSRDFYDREIQKLVGTKGKVLFDITRGKSANPQMKTLQAISKALGQPLDLLQRAIDGELVEPMGTPDSRAVIPADAGDERTVEVGKLDMSLAMGAGTHIEDYVEETGWRFDIEFIRSFTRTPPHRIKIASGIGDSMFPTLLSSDEVFFDTTQTRLNLQDKIWACSIRGGGAIKRLRIGPDRKIIVLSDNPAVPEDVVDEEDVRIFGRVLRLVRDL